MACKGLFHLQRLTGSINLLLIFVPYNSPDLIHTSAYINLKKHQLLYVQLGTVLK